MVRYYFVGGYVRDALLGVKSKDVDFAVEASSYDEMRADLIAQGLHIWQERPEYFTIRGKHPQWGDADFTLCRLESKYSDNRHPDNVVIGNINHDLSRRDFTVNAIAMTLEGEYIDPYNGRRDLENNALYAVGNTYNRFKEDSLRMLRAVRFHIVRGFKLSQAIEDAFSDMELLADVIALPSERIYEELVKCYDFDSRATQKFFRKHALLESAIFGNTKLELVPRIRS